MSEANAAEGDVSKRLAQLEEEVGALRRRLEKASRKDSVSIVCFSDSWDKLFAAFTIANGALAMGQEVHMFFTFWGATAIRKCGAKPAQGKNWMQRMVGKMLPRHIDDTPLSKLHFFGLGKLMMSRLMKRKGVENLPSLVERARELGVHFHCCDTSLQLFGWKNEELVDGDASHWCGVSTFLAEALNGKITLFI